MHERRDLPSRSRLAIRGVRPSLIRARQSSQSRGSSRPKVIEELRCRGNARDEQMIPGPCTGNVEQMTLRVIHLLQIGVVAHRFDPFLQGDDFIIAGHHDDGAELQALR